MKNDNSLKSWLTDMNLNHPLVVGGPCSAETEDQVLKIEKYVFSFLFSNFFVISNLQYFI